MTEQDFIDAILAEPDEDVPRLIYADWLEEQGNPRAEFIRLQVELATMTQPPKQQRVSMYYRELPQPRRRKDAERFRAIWDRQLSLHVKHCAEWVKPLIGEAKGVVFERGCVEGISTEPRTFVKHAPLWYRSMPIRQLHVAASSYSPMLDQDWLALLGSPHLSNIQTLELAWAAPFHVETLAECPHLTNLRELLGCSPMGESVLKKLRQSPNLKKLRM